MSTGDFQLVVCWYNIFNSELFVKQRPPFSYTLSAISYIELSSCNARIHSNQ